jgi:hypothetical protein
MVEALETRRLMAVASASTAVGAAGAALSTTQLVTLVLPTATRAEAKAAAATGWGSLGAFPAITGRAVQSPHATSMVAATANLGQIRRLLRNAPLEFTAAAASSPAVLSIPAPDGSMQQFDVWRTVVMAPGLAKKYPGIQTYAGREVGNASVTIQLDVTPQGFHAQVLNASSGAYYIDPLIQGNTRYYASYWQANAVMTAADAAFAAQGAIAQSAGSGLVSGGGVTVTASGVASGVGSGVAEATPALAPPPGAQPANLRVLQLAVAANHQYVAAVGGTVAAAQAAIVTAVNRIDGIFETDLGVRLQLVANNSSVIYPSATGDPYSNTTTAAGQNTPNLNAVLGSSSYDVGIVLTTGSGIQATVGGIQSNATKGSATAGLPTPTGDLFYLDWMGTAMGQEFGATYTFNTSMDPTRVAATAWEPGSGSTIMSSAGYEGTDNLQTSNDPYFNGGSIAQIQSLLATIPNVGTTLVTGNLQPTVSAGSSYVVPSGTPLALTATGSTPNAGETVTYTWEEQDLGVATTLATADNGTSPLFRSMPPTTSPTRYLPMMSTILAGGTNTYTTGSNASERLPTVARSAFKWLVTARDGAGGVAQSSVSYSVVASGSTPFAVTAPNTTNATWALGTTQSVTWTPGITTGAAINDQYVQITLSTDGGATYPYVLAASTTNTGTATFQVPALGAATASARVKVSAVGNIFFDVSNANFTISLPTGTAAPVLTAASDSGVSNSDKITKYNNATPASELTFTVGSTVAGDLVDLYANGILVGSATATGTTTTVTTNGSVLIPDGSVVFAATRQPPTSIVPSASSGAVVTIQANAPTATFSLASPSVRNAALTSAVMTFSQLVTNVSAGSLSLTSDGVPVPVSGVTVSSTGSAYTFSGLGALTTATGVYSLGFSPSAVMNLAGVAMTTAPTPLAFSENVITLPTLATNTLRIAVSATNAASVQLFVNNTGSTADYTWTFSVGQTLRIVATSGNDTVTFTGPSAYNADINLQLAGGQDVVNCAGGTFSTRYNLGSNVTVNVQSGAQVRFGVSNVLAGLNVLAGGTAVAAGSLEVGALTIGQTSGAYSGMLDLTNNNLVWHNGSEATVDAMLLAGQTGGGIRSSTAGTGTGRDKYAGLGAALNTDGQGGVLLSSLAGWATVSSDVLVKYTYVGDTDLDGSVTPADLANLLAGMAGGLTRWTDGDFNYGGSVTAADEALLLASLKNQGAPFT